MLRGMSAGPARMRVVTWNVNGIRARFGEVVELCRLVEPDLLCLQELKATPSQVPEPLTGLPAYASFWHGGPGGYSGVSLHVRRAWAADVGAGTRTAPPSFDVQSRAVEVALSPRLRALSLYVPNGNRDLPGKIAFLSALLAHVRQARETGVDLLLLGDLNVARADIDIHPTLRDPRSIGQTVRERELLAALLAEGDLIDVGRATAPDDDGLFTWWPPWREERRKNHGWRLDYVLATTRLANAISSCRVLAEFGTSDHAPVEAVLSVSIQR